MPVLIKQYLYLWPSSEGYWWRGFLCPTSPLFSPNNLDSFNPGFTCFSLMDSFLPSLVFRVACCWALRCTLALLGRAEDALSVTASWGSIWKQSTHHLNCSKGLLLASFSSVPYCVNGESGFLSLRCILQVHFWCFSFGAARIQRVHRERRMTGSTAVFPSWNPLNPLKGR